MPQAVTQLHSVANLGELLTQAGAKRPQYGKKWSCPACGGKGCLSVDEPRGLFHCWHPGCDFKGNTATLARRLGMVPKLSPEECRRRQEQERRLGERVARILAAKHKRRSEVIDRLTHFYRVEYSCHVAGPSNPYTRDALAAIYAERLRLEAERLILDDARGPDLERFLGLSKQSVNGDIEAAIDNVIIHGGLTDRNGQFVPLETESMAGAASEDGTCAPGLLYEMVAPNGAKAWHADGTWHDACGRVVKFRW